MEKGLHYTIEEADVNRNKYKLTKRQFQKATAGTYYNPQTLKALMRVMVDGLTYKEAAEEIGVTKQFIAPRVKRIWEIHCEGLS